MSFQATDGRFIFSQLGWVLGAIGTPAPSPQEERERPCGLRGGESLYLSGREGLLSVITCAPELELS